MGFKRQFDLAVIGKQGQFIQQILNQGFQGEWHEVNGRFAAREIRKGQQGTRQSNKPSHLLKIVDKGFAIFFRRSGFHEGNIQVALQYGQGGFHFVGGDVAKPPLNFTAPLEPVHHGVESLGEPTELLIV